LAPSLQHPYYFYNQPQYHIMKKYAFLLLAGSIIGLSSCGDDSNTTTQEQIDSIANARSAAMEAELTAKNDSLINAMAMMKADSAARADSLAALKAGRPVTTTKTRTTTKPATTKTTTTKSKQEEKFDSRGNANTPISEEKKKEQEDKFNRR
jgi:hypothetical protein